MLHEYGKALLLGTSLLVGTFCSDLEVALWVNDHSQPIWRHLTSTADYQPEQQALLQQRTPCMCRYLLQGDRLEMHRLWTHVLSHHIRIVASILLQLRQFAPRQEEVILLTDALWLLFIPFLVLGYSSRQCAGAWLALGDNGSLCWTCLCCLRWLRCS